MQNPLFHVKFSALIACDRVPIECNETCKKNKLQKNFHHLYVNHIKTSNSQSNNTSVNYIINNNTNDSIYSNILPYLDTKFNSSRINEENKNHVKKRKISLLPVSNGSFK